MSNNAELIKAIKDAENALTKAINTLNDITDENNDFGHDNPNVRLTELQDAFQAIEQKGSSASHFANATRLTLLEVISLRKRVDEQVKQDEEKRRVKEEEDKRISEFWELQNKLQKEANERWLESLTANSEPKRGWFK